MSARLDWISANWPAPAGIIAGCSTRAGGVSRGDYGSLNLGAHVGDQPDDVDENRRRLIDGCGLPSEPPWLTQVHGREVVTDIAQGTLPQADSIVARGEKSVCAVLVADCLPVLFASLDGREIAAAHAGWRGLSAGVLEATVNSLQSRTDEILAWLGPAISAPNFEVGDEVREAFTACDPSAEQAFVANERGRWQADLYHLATQRLHRAGVRQVFGGGYCTYADSARFFSYRRDGQCGRMAAFISRVS